MSRLPRSQEHLKTAFAAEAASAARFRAYGARVVHGRSVPGALLGTLGALAASRLRGERPMLVPSGGSSWRGNLGFVSAGLELAAQVEAGALPEPAQLFVAVGTGGTAAGLALGLRLGGLATRIVAVRVSDILPPGRRRLGGAGPHDRTTGAPGISPGAPMS